MRWLVIFVSVFALASAFTVDTSTEPNQKGLIDWISSWVTPTPTTTRPTIEPPVTCPECHCGIAKTRRRIVGGYETLELKMYWLVILLYGGRYYCGGTLINDLYILTAAHCVAGFRKDKISVRFLEHDRSTPNETKTIDRNVSSIIRHQRYNPGNYDNDIALLKMNIRLPLSSAIKRLHNSEEDEVDMKPVPVCLPTPGLSFSNYTALVSGWGTTEEGGSVSDKLREVYVPIMSNAECRQTMYKDRITDNMLCAGYPEGGRDACQGDSGGPLHVLNTTTNKYHEVGVVSWGEGCARPDRPGVYTRVNRYLTWIKSNTKDACYCQ